MAKNTFAEELKARRKQNKHTMEQVAAIVGIPDRRIYGQIERGCYLQPNGKPKDMPSAWMKALRDYKDNTITKEPTKASGKCKPIKKVRKPSTAVQAKLWEIQKKKNKLQELIQSNPVTKSMLLERIWSWNPKRNKNMGINIMGYMAADINNGAVSIGVSICHASDTFKTKIGRALAINRISQPIDMIIKEDGSWNPDNFFELQYLRFVERVVKYFSGYEIILPNITFVE